MNFLKSNESQKPTDVKMVRECLLQFIKEQLRKVEGGEGSNIKGLQLFISSSIEKHIYEAAVYFNEEQRFKNEVQRIADDFAIDLPTDWTLEISFVDVVPSEAAMVPDLEAGIFISTKKRSLQRLATAYIKVLNGEAEKKMYIIKSTDEKITIGREKTVQTASGFFRTNVIAFLNPVNNESNKYVSRQHAHIQFQPDSQQFYLYADEGGVPPLNKIKVKSVLSETTVKLYSIQIGHPLQEGDQIMLGKSAILEFTYLNESLSV